MKTMSMISSRLSVKGKEMKITAGLNGSKHNKYPSLTKSVENKVDDAANQRNDAK